MLEPQIDPGRTVDTYLLRLVLPDQPGSLGVVASAIGAVGGDITSVAVVEKGDDYAVDDFVVSFAAHQLADVTAAAESLPGVRIEVFRPIVDDVYLPHELDLVDRLVDAGTQALSLVTHLSVQLFRASWALVLMSSDGGVVTRNATPGSPVMVWTSLPFFPLEGPMTFDADAAWLPEKWRDERIALAAAPVGDGNTALLVGRKGGPRFRSTEIERLGHLAHVAATVGRRS
jgi:hypothetical protein